MVSKVATEVSKVVTAVNNKAVTSKVITEVSKVMTAVSKAVTPEPREASRAVANKVTEAVGITVPSMRMRFRLC